MDYEQIKQRRKIFLGADHAGYELKEVVKEWLVRNQYEIVDMGADEYDEDDDYPDFISPVAKEISTDEEAFGIIFGGSGQGEAMVANRFPGVRAAVFYGKHLPEDDREVPNGVALARQHNDANILSLGARFMTNEEALEAVETFLETSFSQDERHERRIGKIDSLF